MNWSQAKTILIVFFICTNLFLLSTIIISLGRTTIVSEDLIDYTVNILSNNRIDIDPRIIPKRLSPIPYEKGKNAIESYDSFVKNFIGDDFTFTEDKTYSNNVGNISFYGDKFTFTPTSPALSDVTKKLNSNNAGIIGVNVLNKYGIYDNYMVTDQYSYSDGTAFVTISKKKDNLLFFNSHIDITMSRDGVLSISGSWFYDDNSPNKKITLKNITGVLIEYISLANRPNTAEEIVSLDLGYSTLEEGIYHKELSLTPCWKISLKDGSSYILNAIEISD